MVLRNFGRGRPLNAPAAFIHPCQPIVAKQPFLFYLPMISVLTRKIRFLSELPYRPKAGEGTC